MADFFTRLAERTLGVAPVIRPLTTPMFASGPVLAGDPVASAAWEDGSSTPTGDPSKVQRLLTQKTEASGGVWEEELTVPTSNPGEAPVASRRFFSRSPETRVRRDKELSRSQPDRRSVPPGLLSQGAGEDAQIMTDSQSRNTLLSVSPASGSQLRESPDFPELSQRLVFPFLVAKEERDERSRFQPGRKLSPPGRLLGVGF